MKHYPQCTCNNNQSIMRRSLSLFSLEKNEDSCRYGKKWCQITGVPEESSKYYETVLRVNYEKEALQPSVTQIDLDVPRTFLESPYFSKGTGGEILKRVLYAISRYNPNLGYVQGMNYIVACLLYHCSESDAFWLFLKLVYDYDLVQNYLPQLPGLEKHSHIIEFLMMEHLPLLNEHLMQCGVIPQMFITEWCITLFTTLLNLQYAHSFINQFFKVKWKIFYQVTVEILARLEEKLMQTSNPVKILDLMKPVRANSAKASLEFLRTLENGEKLSWERFIQICKERVINDDGILCLSENFETFLSLNDNL